MSIARLLRAIGMGAALALFTGTACRADSTYVASASSGSTASGHLDFSVVVPAVLYLRIGTGNAIGGANNGTVDSMTFTVPSVHLGDGTPIAASAGSGDLGNGNVTVRIFSNVGTSVNLNSSITGQLSDGSGDTIPWSRITVAPATLTSTTPGFVNEAIAHPAFAATSGSGTPTSLAPTSGVVAVEGKWAFAYANLDLVPAGTYGSNAAGNGVITYTVTQL